MTVSDITILKTSHEVYQILKMLSLQFQFCPLPAVGKEYPQTAACSKSEVGVSG